MRTRRSVLTAVSGLILMVGFAADGASQTGVWTAQAPAHSPAGRLNHAMVYDSDRGVVVLFGGQGQGNEPTYGDTWEWDGVDWHQVTFSDGQTVPPPRASQAMAYDSGRKRVVMFGGDQNWPFLNDTWEFDGVQWTQVALNAPAPAPRYGAAAAYDPIRQKTVLFGGWNPSSGLFGDTWEWDGTSWIEIPATGPQPRDNAALFFDAVRGRVVLYEGVTYGGIYQDMWEYHPDANPPAWVKLSIDPSQLPTYQVYPYFTYVADAAVALSFGGCIPGSPTVAFNDMWEWNSATSTWTSVAAQNSPSPRFDGGFGMVYDSGHHQIVIFGGEQADGVPPQETWTYQDPSWTAVAVRLQDSHGNPMSGATVQYYAGSWLSFGTTGADGAARQNIPAGTYTFRMIYLGGVQDQLETVGPGSSVVFQTTNVTVQLKNSAGAPLDPGTVQYYAGSWRSFGTTSGGQVSLELLPLSYTFRMTYAGGVQDQLQNVATSATVVFQSTNVTVKLTNSLGAPLDPGTAQYYAGTWHTIGTTSSGQVSVELLPLSYTFRMTYLGGVQNGVQNVATNATVVFATAVVHSNTGTCTKFYAGAWRAFVQDMELLPGTYTFRFNDGTPDTVSAVTVGVVNHIH